MSVNGITSVGGGYEAYTQTAKQTESTEKKEATSVKDESAVKNSDAVIYEPSSKKNTGKANKAVVEQMKADQQARFAQLQSIVLRTINKQGETYNKANDIWSILSKGDFTVDAATKSQAQADIAEDGYWGVNATSSRIVDFAVALAGDDKDKLEEMRSAFEKGYKMAEKTWGGKLPDICKKTYDAVFKKFDELTGVTETTEADTE